MENIKKNLLSIILVVLAGLTLIPIPGKDINSVLGYHSLCGFTPYSTSILILTSGIIYYLKNRKGKENGTIYTKQRMDISNFSSLDYPVERLGAMEIRKK